MLLERGLPPIERARLRSSAIAALLLKAVLAALVEAAGLALSVLMAFAARASRCPIPRPWLVTRAAGAVAVIGSGLASPIGRAAAIPGAAAVATAKIP